MSASDLRSENLPTVSCADPNLSFNILPSYRGSEHNPNVVSAAAAALFLHAAAESCTNGSQTAGQACLQSPSLSHQMLKSHYSSSPDENIYNTPHSAVQQAVSVAAAAAAASRSSLGGSPPSNPSLQAAALAYAIAASSSPSPGTPSISNHPPHLDSQHSDGLSGGPFTRIFRTSNTVDGPDGGSNGVGPPEQKMHRLDGTTDVSNYGFPQFHTYSLNDAPNSSAFSTSMRIPASIVSALSQQLGSTQDSEAPISPSSSPPYGSTTGSASGSLFHAPTTSATLLGGCNEATSPRMASGSYGSTGRASAHGHYAEDGNRKREHRLQKNREAARECRRKKKEYVKCLEHRVAILEGQNQQLIKELRKIKSLYFADRPVENNLLPLIETPRSSVATTDDICDYVDGTDTARFRPDLDSTSLQSLSLRHAAHPPSNVATPRSPSPSHQVVTSPADQAHAQCKMEIGDQDLGSELKQMLSSSSNDTAEAKAARDLLFLRSVVSTGLPPAVKSRYADVRGDQTTSTCLPNSNCSQATLGSNRNNGSSNSSRHHIVSPPLARAKRLSMLSSALESVACAADAELPTNVSQLSEPPSNNRELNVFNLSRTAPSPSAPPLKRALRKLDSSNRRSASSHNAEPPVLSKANAKPQR